MIGHTASKTACQRLQQAVPCHASHASLSCCKIVHNISNYTYMIILFKWSTYCIIYIRNSFMAPTHWSLPPFLPCLPLKGLSARPSLQDLLLHSVHKALLQTLLHARTRCSPHLTSLSCTALIPKLIFDIRILITPKWHTSIIFFFFVYFNFKQIYATSSLAMHPCKDMCTYIYMEIMYR